LRESLEREIGEYAYSAVHTEGGREVGFRVEFGTEE
jgi:hypothetical protein